MMQQHRCVLLALCLVVSGLLGPAADADKRQHTPKPKTSRKKLSEDEIFQQEMQRQKALESRLVEKELNTWKPTSENDHSPKAALLIKDANILGFWSYGPGMSSSSVRIYRNTKNEFNIDFNTGGCVGAWELKRTGRYVDGVLTLNRPVKEYPDGKYNRLYTVRVGKTIYLVADINVEEFQKYVSADGQKVSEETQWCSYRLGDW